MLHELLLLLLVLDIVLCVSAHRQTDALGSLGEEVVGISFGLSGATIDWVFDFLDLVIIGTVGCDARFGYGSFQPDILLAGAVGQLCCLHQPQSIQQFMLERCINQVSIRRQVHK